MPKQDIPGDADPVFREVMNAIRTGKNPDHRKREKLNAKQQAAVDKALRKRKGKHTQGFRDDVIDTGMFS